MYSFNSRAYLLNSFAKYCDDVKNEPMFFNSDLEFAYEKGGPITRSFISSMPQDWLSVPCVFDSRVHMLMSGWYPGIPGYHHDDVPRPPIPVGQHFLTAGQPDYDTPAYHSRHIMGLVNAHLAPTSFALGECELPKVNGLIYRDWDTRIKQMLEENKLAQWEAPDRQLIEFDWQTFHSGTKAVGSGWRWFGRVSRDTDRVKTITNELRAQTQVYLEFPMEGW